jgi:hypothetical protein
MNIGIEIVGLDNVVNGLRNAASYINGGTVEMIDKAAIETALRMKENAPVSSGVLANSIEIDAPTDTSRTIGPNAKNYRPGNTYGLPVETGASITKLPNVESLYMYLGDWNYAWAMAISLRNRGSTPSNPFVLQTFEWLKSQIATLAEPFYANLVASYQAGGVIRE